MRDAALSFSFADSLLPFILFADKVLQIHVQDKIEALRRKEVG